MERVTRPPSLGAAARLRRNGVEAGRKRMPADKILIVEDEREVAQTLERYLKRLAYSVAGIVDNGEEALAIVAKARPDLALMDIEIQGAMDGIELAERFRKQHDVPVIFLTGRSDDETLER